MTDQVERRYDLRSDEFRANPYPTWSAMREQDPVYRNPDFQNWMSLVDAPRHTVLRGLVFKAFTPGTVRQLRPFIQEVVDRHLARVCRSATPTSWPISPIRSRAR